MSGDDELRDEHAGRNAGHLLDLALGAADGDLDEALPAVPAEDALAVLDATIRQLAELIATQRLRDLGPDDDRGLREAADGACADVVSDDELPPGQWESGDPTTNALEHGTTLWEGLAE